MAGLPPGIKNWHWRTKGVESWSKDWWRENLVGLETQGVSIFDVKDVEGDAELGMRKSKLVTIYDQKITLAWSANSKSGDSITGSLIAVEVAHDMDEDEYVFEAAVETSSKEAEEFRQIARTKLADKCRSVFQKFPKAMLDTHGKDLLTDDASAPVSGTSTPSLVSDEAKKSVPTSKPVASKTNTAVVRAQGEFACSSADLFEFLTSEAKIPVWSRNSATMKPEVGADVSLFGGNISGKVTVVNVPSSIAMTWKAPTWPEGHHGLLEIELSQGSNSTTLNLRLSGVPVGMEDETERNLNGYYINGLKSIGSVLASSSSTLPVQKNWYYDLPHVPILLGITALTLVAMSF